MDFGLSVIICKIGGKLTLKQGQIKELCDIKKAFDINEGRESAPEGALEVPFLEIITDRLTDQPTSGHEGV